MSDLNRLPELLCPAGNAASLDAAIEGGADAVYLGGSAMNARVHAGNFDPVQLREAVKRAHAHGVKVYLTLNTMVTDRELELYLDAAKDASRAGVDALIVADAGGAALIHRAIPELELHASTQMSGHNSLMGAELKRLGFSRMVAAREISEENLERLLQDSPIETEVFVHGALCVSHSGQCLFSSLVGGRSGNRGECAQPCRLPFCGKGREERYPLSLKDLSLATHVPRLIGLGVASLKIEGRMKSPEYVYETTRVWRRLLDEGRGATPQELRAMADAFSRGGFTDGYFTERIGSSMLGVRSEADKQRTERVQTFGGLQKRVPLELRLRMVTSEPVSLTLAANGERVTVEGDVPEAARTAPMSAESVQKSICKLGGTCYEATQVALEVGEGLMMPVSRLNELRRRGVEALEVALAPAPRREEETVGCRPAGKRQRKRTARFDSPEQITGLALQWFDEIYLPLFRFAPPACGVVMPPVIFDGDADEVRAALRRAVEAGATRAIVGNLGHLSLVREAGLTPVGDFRLNLANRETAALCESLGLEEAILSPELTLPQMRDIGGNTAAIVYGRIPLMTLEKCIAREIADCNVCANGRCVLKDRRGVVFPVVREWKHRNVVLNSLPTCMSDRADQLAQYGILNQHYLFTLETSREVDRVIEAYRCGTPMEGESRRIGTGKR